MHLVRRRWADIDLTMDGNGNSVLMLAAASGHVSLVKRLLTKQWPGFVDENIGGRFNQVNRQGNTALMLAAANGHLEVVRYLLDNNAGFGRIDMANYSGKTALVMAKENRHEDVCQFLTSRAVSQVVRNLCSRVEESARKDAVSQVVEDLCSHVEESVCRDFASGRDRSRSIEEERPSKRARA